MEELILKNSLEAWEIQSVTERVNKLCEETCKLEDALERTQNSNLGFSFNESFDSIKYSMLKTVLVNMGKTYESIRSDLGRIVHAKCADFEIKFPKLCMNFETYYTIVVSLLNLTYQLKYMKIYCQLILES
jgi:hypothetical protein